MTKWLIIGAGVSGLGAAKFLRQRGDDVRVSDGKKLARDKAAEFIRIGADLRDGGHDPSHLDEIERVVLSPGLKDDHPLITLARQRGLPLVSEIDLAMPHARGPVVGVTGTNGKSTVCAMLGHILERAGKSVSVGGNFGDPPTAMLAEERLGEYLVLELSSYQLEQSQSVHCDAALFTSFSHDHLARHGSLEGYLAAKWRLFDQLKPDGLVVLPKYIADLAQSKGLRLPPHRVLIERGDGTPHDDTVVLTPTGRLKAQTSPEIDFVALGVTSPHNQLNAAMALFAAARITGQNLSKLAPLIGGFEGLPHRCELVGHRPSGAPVINDSKSTNVESTLVALAGVAGPVILMMGGIGKGEPYAPILAERAKIAALVTFGTTGPEIAAHLKRDLKTYEFTTLAEAMRGIGGILERHPGALLFSPGCASFDEFENYAARGDSFRRGIQSCLKQ
jgi:UDP-N-acetylmuramoylalanine--D-glutamate ligase